MRHFASSVLRVLGVGDGRRPHHVGAPDRPDRRLPDGRRCRGLREARGGSLPSLRRPRPCGASDELRILVGIDRLDYTKGIPRRLLAFEALLRAHPELHGRVRLIQVAVPSRTNVEAYQEFREQVDATHRSHPRRLCHAGVGADPLPLPQPVAGRGRRALPRGGRDAGDADPRRDEPGGQGVRGRSVRRGRRAGAERVRRCRPGARRGASRQPVRHRSDGRGLLPGAHDAAGRATRAHAHPPAPRREPRRARVGTHVPQRARDRDGGAPAAIAGSVLSGYDRGPAPAPPVGHAPRAPPRLRRDAGAIRAHAGARRPGPGAARAAPRSRERPRTACTS